jgi:predicted GH43/DUF377 family glycosyl hydrolase
MKWVKQGLMIEPVKGLDWMATHAQIPVAERISGSRYRIYFAGRNSDNRSQIGYAEVDLNEPKKILYITKRPVLELGPLGSFDDSGVFPSWLVEHDGKKYLFYIGWMEGKRVPYYASVGLAISTDRGKTYKKFLRGPLLDRNHVDPYMTLSSCVRIENRLWRMWYTSCIRWNIYDGKPRPRYHIKYAESSDGINWKREGTVCIDFESEDEWAIARPCVIKEGGIYKMWYSYSSRNYKIGYAESSDGIRWRRKDDNAGLDVSKTGWDSEMVAYAFIFLHNEKKYMLYNGNSFGKNGMGYAVLDSSS